MSSTKRPQVDRFKLQVLSLLPLGPDRWYSAQTKTDYALASLKTFTAGGLGFWSLFDALAHSIEGIFKQKTTLTNANVQVTNLGTGRVFGWVSLLLVVAFLTVYSIVAYHVFSA